MPDMEYVSVSVLVLVLVLVSKLETLFHSCNSNWRHFSEGHSWVSASPRKLIPVNRRSPYVASRVEEWGCRHWRFRVKVHTLQLIKLPRSHSWGVHTLLGFMATITTAGLSSLSQITYPAHCRGQTATLPGGFVCVCRHLPSIRDPLPTHFL